MNSNPLVTIIIPCYNHEKYIKKCIDSVLNQTYKNIELIVVDNGSLDHSGKIIKEYVESHRIKLISLENNIPHGVVNGALSIALKEASGEYVSLLYSDDWYLPRKIEEQVRLFQKSPSSVGLIYCHGFRYVESADMMKKWIMGSERGYVFHAYLTKGDLVIPISPLVKKYCYDLVGTDHLWTGSEYDFFSMSQFVDFDYVDDYLVVMRNHDSNDAKNVRSVYDRVCAYDKEFFSNKSTVLRASKYIPSRLSRTYLMFARDFAEIGNREYAKTAFYKALLSNPICFISLRGLIILIYLLVPERFFHRTMRFGRVARKSIQNSIFSQ